MAGRISWIAAVTAAIFGALAALSACEFVDDSKDGGSDSGYYYDTGNGSDTGEYYY
jgi:hypothetical protein